MPPKRRAKKVIKKRAPPVTIKPTYDIRVLDHLALCGPATSTRGMFMVKEKREEKLVVHQVFVDKHGIYCAIHGVTCPAIEIVEKANKKLKVYS